MDEALFHGVNYTTIHNASNISELRTLSTEELLNGSGDRVNGTWIWWVTALSCNYPLIFKPVLDGYVLPMKYIEQLAVGPANDLPLIRGALLPLNGYTVDEYMNYTTLNYGMATCHLSISNYIHRLIIRRTPTKLGTQQLATHLLLARGHTLRIGSCLPPALYTPITGTTLLRARMQVPFTKARSCMLLIIYMQTLIRIPSRPRITTSLR